jgi:hypothetical protein
MEGATGGGFAASEDGRYQPIAQRIYADFQQRLKARLGDKNCWVVMAPFVINNLF